MIFFFKIEKIKEKVSSMYYPTTSLLLYHLTSMSLLSFKYGNAFKCKVWFHLDLASILNIFLFLVILQVLWIRVKLEGYVYSITTFTKYEQWIF